MPDEYRVTIRLSPELYAQLAAHGSHRQPVAAIVRNALLDYLSRQPETPTSPTDLDETVAAMAASIAALQDQVQALTARLDPGSRVAASGRHGCQCPAASGSLGRHRRAASGSLGSSRAATAAASRTAGTPARDAP